MLNYAFELSGEHQTLPRCEALALVEMYSSSFKELCCLDQCLIIEARDLDVCTLGKRLALTHRIIEVLAICDALPGALASAVSRLELPRKRYLVRARRIKDASPKADEVEHEVGRVLFQKGYKADIKNPEIVLRAIISTGKIILGLEVRVVLMEDRLVARVLEELLERQFLRMNLL